MSTSMHLDTGHPITGTDDEDAVHPRPGRQAALQQAGCNTRKVLLILASVKSDYLKK
jgi:hypothetical protein